MKKNKITQRDKWFYSGVICALIVLVDDGWDSHAEEILKCCGGLEEIRQIAEEEGDVKIVKLVNSMIEKRVIENHRMQTVRVGRQEAARKGRR